MIELNYLLTKLAEECWNEVCFSRGYTSTRMTYNIGSITIDTTSINDLGRPAIKIELLCKAGEKKGK